MVGIPKSKGCKTCRERKLRCDQQRPSCDRCVRTGRECGGYEKQTLWKNSFASSTRGRYSVSSTSKLSPKSSSSENSPQSAESAVNIINLSASPKEVRNGPSYQLQFLSLFLTSYMPRGEDSTVPSSGRMPLIVWPHRLPDMVGRSMVVDSAVNAMITSYLGVAKQDVRLMKESMPLYAVAIRNVYNATLKAHHGVTEDILSAIMAMTMFEMFLSTETGWMSHVQGGAALIQQRGPPTTASPINTDLLRRFRSLTICDCIGRRKRTFFDRPEWQRLNGPHPYDDLLDIMSSIPRLLEEVDRLARSSITTDNAETLEALHLSLSLEERIQSWYAALQSSVNNVPLFWQVPRSQDPQDEDKDPELGQLFLDKLFFGSLRLAQLHQLFWAVTTEIYAAMEELLLTHERIRRLSPTSISQTLPSASGIPNFPHDRSITQISALATYYADLCCQAQHYICSPEMGAVGPQSTLAALGMVKMFYQMHDTRKFRWVKRELERLIGRGFGAARLLSSLNREGYASLGKGPAWVSKPEHSTWEDQNILSEVPSYVTMPIRSQEKQIVEPRN